MPASENGFGIFTFAAQAIHYTSFSLSLFAPESFGLPHLRRMYYRCLNISIRTHRSQSVVSQQVAHSQGDDKSDFKRLNQGLKSVEDSESESA